MKTYQPKHKDIKRDWQLVDAKDQVLGRMASGIAKLLMGKHKVNYSRHMDMGDNVVIINASEVVLTGKKADDKVYFSHSGYPGGFKKVSYKKMMSESPEKVVRHAVAGMLPKNRTQKKRLTRLKVFAGSSHKYQNMFQSKKAEVAGNKSGKKK
ncbi:50S ribosomal protein L13 [Patescibacteria group bacterium]